MTRRVLSKLFFAGLCGLAVAGTAQSFTETPVNWGLAAATAHTLRSSELQIGLADVLSTGTLYVNYGLTEEIELGFWPIRALEGLFNVSGKFAFAIGDDLQMAFPVSYYYWNNRGGQYHLHAGAVVNVQLGEAIDLDAGVNIITGKSCWWNSWWSRWDCSPVLVTQTYALLQYEIAETARVLLEVRPTGLMVRTGLLLRLLDRIDLRATVGLVPSVSVWLGVEVRLGGDAAD